MQSNKTIKKRIAKKVFNQPFNKPFVFIVNKNYKPYNFQ